MDSGSELFDDDRDLITIVPEYGTDNYNSIPIESHNLGEMKIYDDEPVITGVSAYGRKTLSLPVTFLNIPRNVRLLSACKPLSVDIVDCDKHPNYYKVKRSKVDSYSTIKVEVDISRDDDVSSGAETIDLNVEHEGFDEEGLLGACMEENRENLHHEDVVHSKNSEIIISDQQVDSSTSSEQPNSTSRLNDSIKIVPRDASDLDESGKNENSVSEKKELLPNKFFSCNNTNKCALKLAIDPKRNKGLIGLKINKQIVLDDLDDSDDDCQIIEDPYDIKTKNNIVINIVYSEPKPDILNIKDKVSSWIDECLNEAGLQKHSEVNMQNLEKNRQDTKKENPIVQTEDSGKNKQLQLKDNIFFTEKVMHKNVLVVTPNKTASEKIIIDDDFMIVKPNKVQDNKEKKQIVEKTIDVKLKSPAVNRNVQVVLPNKVKNVILDEKAKDKVKLNKSKTRQTKDRTNKKAKISEKTNVTLNKITDSIVIRKENVALETKDEKKKEKRQIIEDKLLDSEGKVNKPLIIKLDKENQELFEKTVIDKHSKKKNIKVQIIENKLIDTHGNTENLSATQTDKEKLVAASFSVNNKQDQKEKNNVIQTLVKLKNNNAQTNNEKVTLTEDVLLENIEKRKNTVSDKEELRCNLNISTVLSSNTVTKLTNEVKKEQSSLKGFVDSKSHANNSGNSDCVRMVNKTNNTKGMRLNKCIERINKKRKEINEKQEDCQVQSSFDTIKEQNEVKINKNASVDVNSAQFIAASSSVVHKEKVRTDNNQLVNSSKKCPKVIQENKGETPHFSRLTQATHHSELTHQNNAIFQNSTVAFKKIKISSILRNSVSTQTNAVRPFLYKPNNLSTDATPVCSFQDNSGKHLLPVICVTSQPDNNSNSGTPFSRLDRNMCPANSSQIIRPVTDVKKVTLLHSVNPSGYSPPILPIPSLRRSLEMLDRYGRHKKRTVKPEVGRPAKKSKPAKKISTEEYKNRLNINIGGSEPS